MEHPVDANALVHDFIGRAGAPATERAAKRLGRAARRLQVRINSHGQHGNGGRWGRNSRNGGDTDVRADAA